MNIIKKYLKLKFILLLVLSGFFIYLGILYYTTQGFALIIQQKNYSPGLERQLLKAEACSKKYMVPVDTKVQDDEILGCYASIEAVKTASQLYPKWRSITISVQDFYKRSGLIPGKLDTLEHMMASTNVGTKRHEDIKDRLIRKLSVANSFISGFLTTYQNTYPDREVLTLDSAYADYSFHGNIVSTYLVCTIPERLGFKDFNDCTLKLKSTNFEYPPAR